MSNADGFDFDAPEGYAPPSLGMDAPTDEPPATDAVADATGSADPWSISDEQQSVPWTSQPPNTAAAAADPWGDPPSTSAWNTNGFQADSPPPPAQPATEAPRAQPAPQAAPASAAAAPAPAPAAPAQQAKAPAPAPQQAGSGASVAVQLQKQIAERTAKFDKESGEKDFKLKNGAKEHLKELTNKREEQLKTTRAEHVKDQQEQEKKKTELKKSGAVWNGVAMVVDLKKPNSYSKNTERMRKILQVMDERKTSA